MCWLMADADCHLAENKTGHVAVHGTHMVEDSQLLSKTS